MLENIKKTAGLILFLILLILCFVTAARAESGDFNIHLETGPGFALSGWQAEELGTGVFGEIILEYPFEKWVGAEIGGGFLYFFDAHHPEGYRQMDSAYLANTCLGIRFRPLNDEEGYMWPWSTTPDHTGNIWGNLWIDLHGDMFMTGENFRFGADIGLGAELSILNGLQIGPMLRGLYVYQPDSDNDRDSQDAWILLAGLSGSITLPPEGKHMKDSDGDGFYDPEDGCPENAEDADGFEDEDGCPDEDNDGDGVHDVVDACMNEPEDADGFEDGDGCPDSDNDGDTIPDEKDKCPDKAEDADGFEDEDGCPDNDNDRDTINDTEDSCPDEAETVNGYNDSDGCPEADRDNDGFVDDLDECPEEPETVNGLDDDDGCPDQSLVEVRKNMILLGERIFFDFGMARIKSRSRQLLDDLANLIRSHPEYVLISIEGHADRTGPKDFNLKLSRRRADRVRRHLIKLGIDPERLHIRAMGESSPWIKAGDEEARDKNRRVEFRIEKLDENLSDTPVAPETRDAHRETLQEAGRGIDSVEDDHE